jgi:hypothetical protein
VQRQKNSVDRAPRCLDRPPDGDGWLQYSAKVRWFHVHPQKLRQASTRPGLSGDRGGVCCYRGSVAVCRPGTRSRCMADEEEEDDGVKNGRFGTERRGNNCARGPGHWSGGWAWALARALSPGPAGRSPTGHCRRPYSSLPAGCCGSWGCIWRAAACRLPYRAELRGPLGDEMSTCQAVSHGHWPTGKERSSLPGWAERRGGSRT